MYVSRAYSLYGRGNAPDRNNVMQNLYDSLLTMSIKDSSKTLVEGDDDDAELIVKGKCS